MNQIPVIDLTATGINITRLRIRAGLKGCAGCLRVRHTTGHLQMAARHGIADRGQFGHFGSFVRSENRRYFNISEQRIGQDLRINKTSPDVRAGAIPPPNRTRFAGLRFGVEQSARYFDLDYAGFQYGILGHPGAIVQIAVTSSTKREVAGSNPVRRAIRR